MSLNGFVGKSEALVGLSSLRVSEKLLLQGFGLKCLVKSRAVEGLLLVLAKAFLQALGFESLRSFKGLDVRAVGLVHGPSRPWCNFLSI